MRKPAYTYVKNKDVDQLARQVSELFCLHYQFYMAYISIKLLDCVNSQTGLCFTWLKPGAFMMKLILTRPLFRK